MIRVFDGAIPPALCSRVVNALQAAESEAGTAGFPGASTPLADLAPDLEHELLAEFAIPLIWDALGDEPGLSATRSALLPDLARVLREGPGAGPLEPIRWPVPQGVCLLACLNDGPELAQRSFPQQGRTVRHRLGRVIVCPTAQAFDYALNTGGQTLYTLAAFAEAAAATRVTRLAPGLSEDELRCLTLMRPVRPRPSPRVWPSAPVRPGLAPSAEGD